MLDNGWVEIKNEYINPSFLTHLNYIKTFRDISNNLKITCNINCKKPTSEPKELSKKLKLIKLTKESMDSEMRLIKANPEFAILCISWVSVKSYYLLFNLLTITEYLLSADVNIFKNVTHEQLRKRFKDRLINKEVAFNIKEMNNVYRWGEIVSWKFVAGTNLRTSDPDRYKQIVKKLFEYAKEDFKRYKKVKQLRNKLKQEFIDKSRFNLVDFFYYYRIKANYRDMEFLDEDMEVTRFVEFYEAYYDLTYNFYNAFTYLINTLSQTRFNKKVI